MAVADLLIAVQCGGVFNVTSLGKTTFELQRVDGKTRGSRDRLWVVFKLVELSGAPAFAVTYFAETDDASFVTKIEFCSAGDPLAAGGRQSLPRLQRIAGKPHAPKVLSDTYPGAQGFGRERLLTLSGIRRVLFFDRTFPRFPVLSIDPAPEGADTAAACPAVVQLVNSGKDPFLRFSLPLRCAISSGHPGKLPHDPEIVSVTGAFPHCRRP